MEHPSFEDVVGGASYGLTSFLAVDDCRKLRATSKTIRLQIPRSVQDFSCRYRGELKWISGQESSFLDGPVSRAKFSYIRSLSCLASGPLILADTNNGVVRAVRKGCADVLTNRDVLMFALACKGEEVYMARSDGIYTFSLGPHRKNVLKHLPTLLFSFADADPSSSPFAVCISGHSIFTTFASSSICINHQTFILEGSQLCGLCAYQKQGISGALVSDFLNNQLLYVDANGVSSHFFSIPTPRCVEILGSTLFVSSECNLYEIRNFDSRPLVLKHNLDPFLPWIGHYISCMTATPDGTLLVGSHSQIFAFV